MVEAILFEPVRIDHQKAMPPMVILVHVQTDSVGLSRARTAGNPDQGFDAVRTPSANYYYVDDLMKLKDKLNPIRGTRKDRKHYTQEQKEQALDLHRQGLKNREIARQLNISYQTINNWVNAQRQAFD